MLSEAKIDKLTEILKRLNNGEEPSALRAEAQQFLASVDASELSIAEQKLIQAGLAPEDLRHLCSIHMEMLKDELDKMKANLQPGHVIHTLVEEHDVILGFLDQLEVLNNSIQKMEFFNPIAEEFHKLADCAKHLVNAEPHHQREEEVLFPEVERRGVTGPTRIMVMEHQDLRRYKKEILALADNVVYMDFEEFKSKLNGSAKLLILSLRDHIFKENNILYPTALDVITDVESWSLLKAECDKIGYCCFTPKG